MNPQRLWKNVHGLLGSIPDDVPALREEDA